MDIKLVNDDFKMDLETIKFLMLKDYKSKKSRFYEKNEFSDMDAIRKWKEESLSTMLSIAKNRKKIVEDYKKLVASKNIVKVTEYISNFLKIFEFKNYYKPFNEIPNDDYLKNKVFQIFSDKKVKKIKTSIYIYPFSWGDDYLNEHYCYDLTLYVLTDEKLDLKKTFTKEEILELYHNKKILVVDTESKKVKNVHGNTFIFYDEFYDCETCVSGFPVWFRQPVCAEIIKKDLQINKELENIINNYKLETKKLAHLMAKSAFMVYKREKQFFDEYCKKAKEDNKMTYERNIEEAKMNFDRKENKLEQEKQNLENGKQEINELINDFLKK